MTVRNFECLFNPTSALIGAELGAGKEFQYAVSLEVVASYFFGTLSCLGSSGLGCIPAGVSP